MNGFQKLLQGCAPEGTKVLDVGAGGFCGATTTQFLAAMFPQKDITLIEQKEGLIPPLKETFPEANVIHGDFFEYSPRNKYGLLSVDLNFQNHVTRWDDILKASHKLLKKGGVLITYTVNSLDGLPMIQENHDDARKFVKEIMETGDSMVSKEVLQEYFSKNELFSFVDCQPKNLLIQWILLQKK